MPSESFHCIPTACAQGGGGNVQREGHPEPVQQDLSVVLELREKWHAQVDAEEGKKEPVYIDDFGVKHKGDEGSWANRFHLARCDLPRVGEQTPCQEGAKRSRDALLEERLSVVSCPIVHECRAREHEEHGNRPIEDAVNKQGLSPLCAWGVGMYQTVEVHCHDTERCHDIEHVEIEHALLAQGQPLM